MDHVTVVCDMPIITEMNKPICPVCGTVGKKVSAITLSSILRQDRVPADPNGYALCLAKDCAVAYFGREIFQKEDLQVRIWFKETGEPIPVCYCKNVTVADIKGHIQRGCCSTLEDIQRHTEANTGKECLTKNLAGT